VKTFVLLCSTHRTRVFINDASSDLLVKFCDVHCSCGIVATDEETHPEGVSEWDGSWGHSQTEDEFDHWLSYEGAMKK
jgi:hypothetical protein